MRVLILAVFGAAFFMGTALADDPAWRASAVVCPLATPGKCLVLEDRRDPQATEDKCKERARAILRSVLPHVGPVLRAGILCEPAEAKGQAA